MRRGNIQLQNTDRSHCRFISAREADELVAIKRAERVSRKGNRTALRLLPIPQPSESPSTPAAFKYREMLAYVGLGSEGAIRAARRKLPTFRPTIRCNAA